MIIANAVLGAIGGGCYSLSGNYMIGQLHYLQEDTIPVSFAGRVFMVLGAGISAVLLPRLGPWKTYMIGSVLIALAPFCFVTVGKYGPYVEKLASSSGNALVAAPQIMYIGAVFQQQDLTRVQMAFGVVGLVPGVVAGQLWPMLFFGEDNILVCASSFKSSILQDVPRSPQFPDRMKNQFARFRCCCAGNKVRASACQSTHPGRQWGGHVFNCLRVCCNDSPPALEVCSNRHDVVLGWVLGRTGADAEGFSIRFVLFRVQSTYRLLLLAKAAASQSPSATRAAGVRNNATVEEPIE
eukprot:COSAG02_NODE_7133_length_3165_cov_2.227658_2_plen_296_part_00